jgi:hypothetical protein
MAGGRRRLCSFAHRMRRIAGVFACTALRTPAAIVACSST